MQWKEGDGRKGMEGINERTWKESNGRKFVEGSK
jgi:hypothetical protein